MVAFEARIEERRQQFKPAVDGHVARRRRESDAVQISKAKRGEVLTKRRIGQMDGQENAAPTNGAQPAAKLEDLPTLIERLRNVDGADRLEPTKALQELITAGDQKCTGFKVVEAGALPELVRSMEVPAHVSSDCAREACWAVSNLASGESAVALTVADMCLTTLLSLFASPDVAVREHAVWAVANIAGDGVEGRDAVLAAKIGDHTGLVVLLELLVASEQNETLLRTCTWALHNLARGQPAPDLSIALPVLAKIVLFAKNLFCEDVACDLLAYSLWTLVAIADGSKEGFQKVMNEEILGQVIALLGHKASAVATPALRLCLNVTASTDEDTATALECGLAAAVKPLLASSKAADPRAALRQDAAMLLSNVACGPPAQVEELFAEGLLESLLGLMSEGPNNVRREAVVAVANACSAGSPPQLLRLVQMDAVKVLCERLVGPDVDTILCALGALRVLLDIHETTEQGKLPKKEIQMFGLEKLEDLQNHENCSVSELAVYLCALVRDDDMDDPHDPEFLDFSP